MNLKYTVRTRILDIAQVKTKFVFKLSISIICCKKKNKLKIFYYICPGFVFKMHVTVTWHKVSNVSECGCHILTHKIGVEDDHVEMCVP